MGDIWFNEAFISDNSVYVWYSSNHLKVWPHCLFQTWPQKHFSLNHGRATLISDTWTKFVCIWLKLYFTKRSGSRASQVFSHRAGLTYDLDDLGEQHPICNVLLQILDQPLVARFCQVVVGPVSVNLLNRGREEVRWAEGKELIKTLKTNAGFKGKLFWITFQFTKSWLKRK